MSIKIPPAPAQRRFISSKSASLKLLLALVALGLAGACFESSEPPAAETVALTGSLADAPTGEKKPAGEEPAEEPAPFFDTRKWNAYVDLNNDLEENFYPALHTYFKAFGNSLEYSPAENQSAVDGFIGAMSSPGQLEREIDRALAAAQNPKTSLDEATGEMALRLKTLWDSLQRSRDYHLSPRLGDQAAQETHAAIYESYLAFEASYAHFRRILNEQDSERRKQDLADMRQRGLVIRPSMLQVVDDAQAIQDFLNNQGITSVTLPSLTMDSFRPLYESLMVSLTQYAMALEGSRQSGREGLDNSRLAAFTQGLQAVKLSAESLIQRHRDKARVEENPHLHIGTPENYNQELGRLVDLYNSAIH